MTLATGILVLGLAITLCAARPAAGGDTQAPAAAQDAKAASSTQDAQKAAAAVEPPKPLAIGAALPMADTKMKNVDGAEVSIAGVRGEKGTLVVFTCNACPWAKAWHSRIVALGNRAAKKGIGVIAINPNDPGVVAEDDFPPMQENAKRSKMAFPYVVDATSEVARAFGATRTPEVFLFDRDGKLVYHGAIDDNAKQPDKVKDRYLDQAVTAVLDGKAVALQETKALGCSIKFRART
jgi:peroxiredoxin